MAWFESAWKGLRESVHCVVDLAEQAAINGIEWLASWVRGKKRDWWRERGRRTVKKIFDAVHETVAFIFDCLNDAPSSRWPCAYE